MARPARILIAALICFALLHSQLAAAAGGRPRIVVVVSHDAAPYRDALSGFQQSLARDGPSGASIDVQFLHGDAGKLPAILQQARREGTDLFFTMGALATQDTLAQSRDTPVVAGMVLSAGALRGSENATGVVLDLPMDVQVEWMKRLLPESRTVGVLYNPRENRTRIEAAERAARARGLKMIAREVESPEALPEAMNSLVKRIDVLWGIVDTVVLSPETAQAVLLFSFRNDIPFVGLSTAWAKAGAIYALDWDYEDVGKQCGELAVKILNGARAGGIAPLSPRKLTYALNLKTVRHMKARIPDSLVRGAVQVFD